LKEGMVMKGVTLTARNILSAGAAAITLGGVLLLAAPSNSGQIAQLVVGEGTGTPGGTAAVIVSLVNDTEESVSADLDILFPTDLVEFIPPVNMNCVIAERLASTHTLAGSLPAPGGILRFAIFDQTGLTPLDNGDLATCNFHVLEGAPTGTAALTVDFAGMVPVEGLDGAIIIGDATPTPTITVTPPVVATATNTMVGPSPPTATNTMGNGGGTPTVTRTATVGQTATNTVGGPTATRTGGDGGTPTSTPTVGGPSPTHTGPTSTVGTPPTATHTGATATVTRTRTGGIGPTPAVEDDGCNVVTSHQSSGAGTWALLLAPALLIWARRRRF
jgi:MYXO-CTERM domain-containing protein